MVKFYVSGKILRTKKLSAEDYDAFRQQRRNSRFSEYRFARVRAQDACARPQSGEKSRRCRARAMIPDIFQNQTT